MTNSILNSTKKQLGLDPDYDAFDLDIMIHINSVFMTLNQLGLGPIDGFEIEDADATWANFLGTQRSPLLNAVKSYMYLKVRLLFDPPAMSFHIASIEKQIGELEWRLNVMREEMLTLNAPVDVIDLPGEPTQPTPPVPVTPAVINANVDGGGADLE